VVIPEEIVIDIGNEALPACTLCLPVVFVPIKLELCPAQMSACHSHRSEETPSNAIKVLFVEGIFLVAVEQSLGVKVEQFKKDECIRCEEQVRWVVNEEFCINKEVLWFHTPLELPNVLKSHKAVAKGKMISLSVASYLF
jgi:hypothetical protein